MEIRNKWKKTDLSDLDDRGNPAITLDLIDVKVQNKWLFSFQIKRINRIINPSVKTKCPQWETLNVLT